MARTMIELGRIIWHRMWVFIPFFLQRNLVGEFRSFPKPVKKKTGFKRQPKPEWVGKEVIRLKAHMPLDGCRKIAVAFNRLHGKHRKMTVGKSYVYEMIRKHHYEILLLRRKVKHRQPKPMPKNIIWSMDLTQVRDSHNQAHCLFGIIDSGTRACLTLKNIPNKASITLLRSLIDGIEQYGKPKIVRTDNEVVFVSRLFRFGLWILGIKHQRTEKCCPWMNGKVERFFGTLKNRLQYHLIENSQTLGSDIALFRCWYNHVRPHQHLNGRTPAEVWAKKQPNSQGKNRYFYAWGGALTGFYLPPG